MFVILSPVLFIFFNFFGYIFSYIVQKLKFFLYGFVHFFSYRF